MMIDTKQLFELHKLLLSGVYIMEDTISFLDFMKVLIMLNTCPFAS